MMSFPPILCSSISDFRWIVVRDVRFWNWNIFEMIRVGRLVKIGRIKWKSLKDRVKHEFFVVETFSRGKRIRNERKLEKELFRSRFEPVESTSGSKNCSKFSLEVRMRLIRFTSCNYSKRIIGKIER